MLDLRLGNVPQSFLLERGIFMKITEQVWQFSQPIVESLGCRLWDVEYVREGGEWYLRLYLDKDGGVDINDCEAVSRAVDPVLDENGNPIEISTMGYGMGDIMVDIYATSQEEYDQFMALYNAIDSIYSYDQEIYNIVNSEAQGFFNGDKTAQDAARQIQSRVTLYINENL